MYALLLTLVVSLVLCSMANTKVVESMRTIKHNTELNYILLFPRAKDGPLELSPRTAAKDGPLEL